MDESSFGPRLENVSFHELRRREMKFQFSLVFLSELRRRGFTFRNYKNQKEKYMNIKKRELIETINCCGTGKQCRGDFKWRYSFVLLVFFHSILIENIHVLYPIECRVDAGQNLFSIFVR